MRNVQTVEQEIKWLEDLGLSAEEKISILELMMETASLEERDLMKEACDAIAVESFLLGAEDK